MANSVSKASQSPATIILRLDNAVCLTAFHPESRRGSAIAIDARKLNSPGLQKEFKKLESQVNAPLSECEFKLVGKPNLVPAVQAFIKENHLTLKATAAESAEKIEVVFYCETGRLRLAAVEDVKKTATPAPVTVTKTPEVTTTPEIVPKKIKVLIVDDSITIQRLLNSILGADEDIEVVATAGRPSQVEDLVAKHKPDVITMDIHMPEMDGVTLLRKIMPRFRIPTVMITSLSIEEGTKVLDALESGAVDYIQKPSADSLKVLAPQIVERVKVASRAKVFQGRAAPKPVAARQNKIYDDSLIVSIGSSTGGTEAVKEVFIRLPEHIPPILVVQHIPPVFSRAFADRLNDLCPFDVKEAEDGDIVRPDLALIAPGGKHMRLDKKHGKLRVVIEETPPRNRHRPSVDVLFDSVAEIMAQHAIGIILTGMGADGAQGLLKMKNAGAKTIAQDEASSVVYGMPREAVKLGAAEPCDLFKIPEQLLSLLHTAPSYKK